MVKMQCNGINKDGSRCQRMVTYNGWNVGDDGVLACHHHRYFYPTPSITPSYAPSWPTTASPSQQIRFKQSDDAVSLSIILISILALCLIFGFLIREIGCCGSLIFALWVLLALIHWVPKLTDSS